MRKIILTLSFILIGCLWLARDSLFNNSLKLETQATKNQYVEKLPLSEDPVPKDKIEQVAEYMQDHGHTQDQEHIQDRAEDFSCRGKWESILSTSYEELKQSLLEDYSTSSSNDPCFLHEQELGIFKSVEKCLEDARAATGSELNKECEDHIHSYRARVIDKYFPDEIGFEKMGYEVLISKLTVFINDGVPLESFEDIKHFKRAIDIVRELIELDPNIKPYYSLLFMNMNMYSFLDRELIPKSQWLNAISDYRNKFGVDSFYYLVKMFVYEIYDGPNEALHLAKISLADLDYSCFSYYHIARLSWRLGENEEAKENINSCLKKNPVHPLMKNFKNDPSKKNPEYNWTFDFKDEFGKVLLHRGYD